MAVAATVLVFCVLIGCVTDFICKATKPDAWDIRFNNVSQAFYVSAGVHFLSWAVGLVAAATIAIMWIW